MHLLTAPRTASMRNNAPGATRCSSADSRGSYSSTWRKVDSNLLSSDQTTLTPDPIAYLKGFDASAATVPYRQALLDACALERGQSVLDVGCGLGGNTPGLRRGVGPAGRVVGVDASERAIAEATARAASSSSAGPAADFLVGDVYGLSNHAGLAHGCASSPQHPQGFDVVVEDRVLQHLVCPLDAVSEMVQMLKPGGRLVCGNP
eukprot:CAMPEP_0171980398 /NCGR_PEP_ID=MMETSP0993-20121228/261363_1 /TAXON_ID=483369 /ORGANISM="non described non described, Strain CCMP2098" /LENGTH=204 /DNA_ID=CAMNT_0012632645 /DNA_START=91 /DNA_END=702 /DNA_ORIENTATION=+